MDSQPLMEVDVDERKLLQRDGGVHELAKGGRPRIVAGPEANNALQFEEGGGCSSKSGVEVEGN